MYLSESLNLPEVAAYWREITNMNEYQKDRFTRRIISCMFNNLTGKRIAVLGFAFKKDTSDTRESPAITLVSNFVAEQANVAIYDPKVKEEQIWRELVDYGAGINEETLKLHVDVCSNAYAACKGADALVVMTEWDEFSNHQDTPVVLKEISPNFPSPSRERVRELNPVDSPKPLAMEAKNGSTTTRFAEKPLGSAVAGARLDWLRIAEVSFPK